ncbi:MAG: cyclase family protein [Myxococcota bacterium]|nr:cyclase family protein [Myxococcota bacterium]
MSFADGGPAGYRPVMPRSDRALLLAACLLAGGCWLRVPTATWSRMIDLSHSFDADTIYWPSEQGFVLEREFAGITDGGYYYEAHRFRGAEHGGTHLDAPIHFAEGAAAVDALHPSELSGPALLIDVTGACERDRDYQISQADFLAWEAEHGPLPRSAIVLLRTGTARYWPERARYLGTELRGPEGVAALHFPGLDPLAAEWLVRDRRIRAIGIDTASIDYGPSRDFRSHRVLFAAGIPAFENLANLEKLPYTGFSIVALPMKIAGGSGAPLRIVALMP